MRICSVSDCEREIGAHGAKGMCPMHYKRFRAGSDLGRPVQPHDQRPPVCEIEGCSNPTKARGLCDKHYMRWFNHGDPTIVRKPWSNRDRTADFLSRVGEPDQNGCHPWTGYIDIHGYGKFGADYAYRLAYELHIGPIPDGLTIDHLCCNPPCVNPDHLEPVTRSENARRQWDSRRTPYCPSGHLYDEANTGRSKDGSRRCRACSRERMRRLKAQP